MLYSVYIEHHGDAGSPLVQLSICFVHVPIGHSFHPVSWLNSLHPVNLGSDDAETSIVV